MPRDRAEAEVLVYHGVRGRYHRATIATDQL